MPTCYVGWMSESDIPEFCQHGVPYEDCERKCEQCDHSCHDHRTAGCGHDCECAQFAPSK